VDAGVRGSVPVRCGGSGPHEAGDGGGGLVDLVLTRPAAGGHRVGDTVPEVLAEQLDGDGLQGTGGGGHLVEHVDAVAVLGDHALEAPHLPLDPPQTAQQLVAPVPVARRCRSPLDTHTR